MIFRRIHGRIIPIIEKNPTVAGAALLIGATTGASAIRRRLAEKVRGKGKQGLGNPTATFLADTAITGGLLYGAHRYGGPAIRKSLSSFQSFMRSSVRGY